METIQFSYAKSHLSEIFDRLAGSHRVCTIRNQRHPDRAVSMLSAEMLDGLLAEIEILKDRGSVKRIRESRAGRKSGRLVEYVPRRA